MPCQWHTGTPCQFEAGENIFVEWNGRTYCGFHLPIAAAQQKADFWGRQAAHDVLTTAQDLTGVQFCERAFQLRATKVPGMSLRRCVFADGVNLNLGSGKFDFAGATFGDPTKRGQGTVVISYSNGVEAHFDQAIVFTRLELQHGNKHQANRWTMCDAKFYGELSVPHVNFNVSLDFSRATFYAPIRFDAETGMPQQTRGIGATFKRGALVKDAEGSYRAARLIFSRMGNRELEGVFYSLEKRCHRRSLGWHPRRWFSRSISAIYGWVSDYGQSYELVAFWLLVTQVAFGVLYSHAAGRLYFGWRAQVDWEVVLFTLVQAVKPFDLLSAKSHASLFGIVNTENLGAGWGALAFFDAVITLPLFALFVLALRWRFKRE